MRPRPNRKSAMTVKDGQVQFKNNWDPHPDDYDCWPQREIRIAKVAPGPGYRHLVTVAQLRSMLELLPDWEEGGDRPGRRDPRRGRLEHLGLAPPTTDC